MDILHEKHKYNCNDGKVLNYFNATVMSQVSTVYKTPF